MASDRRSGFRWGGLLAAAAVAAAVGGGVVVGTFDHADHFNWEVASVAATAAGTLVLAIATTMLAVSTHQSVHESQLAQAEAREPILVVEERPRAEENRDGDLLLRVHIANVGRGAALNVRLDVSYDDSVIGKVDVAPGFVGVLLPQERREVLLGAHCPAGGRAAVLDAGAPPYPVVSGSFVNSVGEPGQISSLDTPASE